MNNNKNANDLLSSSEEAKNIYISSDEKDMGNIMLNSDSIKCVEDMKKFKKKL